MVEIFGRTMIYRYFVKAGCRYCIIHTDFMSCMSVIQSLLELLQACGQIWRPAQQVIRAQGESVVFCCRGKHTENTPVTDGLLLPCA